MGKHDVLIVGGEDHKTGQADDADERFDWLEASTRERFPTAGEVEFRWSGQIMEPIDSLASLDVIRETWSLEIPETE